MFFAKDGKGAYVWDFWLFLIPAAAVAFLLALVGALDHLTPPPNDTLDDSPAAQSAPE